MLDPADCGPATISMAQDVQGEAYDYPEIFFEEKIHEIRRIQPDPNQIKAAAERLKSSKTTYNYCWRWSFIFRSRKRIIRFCKKT